MPAAHSTRTTSTCLLIFHANSIKLASRQITSHVDGSHCLLERRCVTEHALSAGWMSADWPPEISPMLQSAQTTCDFSTAVASSPLLWCQHVIQVARINFMCTTMRKVADLKETLVHAPLSSNHWTGMHIQIGESLANALRHLGSESPKSCKQPGAGNTSASTKWNKICTFPSFSCKFSFKCGTKTGDELVSDQAVHLAQSWTPSLHEH